MTLMVETDECEHKRLCDEDPWPCDAEEILDGCEDAIAVRTRLPRKTRPCPDCSRGVIRYFSKWHFVAGDW